MKILLVSTIKRRVGEDITASRSTIIYELARGLADKGHNVSLLGTADSKIEGVNIIPIMDKGLVDMIPFENPFYGEISYLVMLEKKLEEIADEFDIVHNHTYPEIINLYSLNNIKTPLLTTLHTAQTPEFDEALSGFPNANFVALSSSHKNSFKKTKIGYVVYNGVNTQVYKPGLKKENYMLWIGRLGKAKDSLGNFIDAKGIRSAIELAEKTGEELVLSGNVEDKEFYDKDVRPHLNDKIKWIGGISKEQPLKREEVSDLMQKAKVFLMPVNWDEAFGLVMAESLACGTPVLGFDKGSIPEIVQNDKTGIVVPFSEGVEGLVKGLGKIPEIDTLDCRKRAEELFSLSKMVDSYEDVYKQLAK